MDRKNRKIRTRRREDEALRGMRERRKRMSGLGEGRRGEKRKRKMKF